VETINKTKKIEVNLVYFLNAIFCNYTTTNATSTTSSITINSFLVFMKQVFFFFSSYTHKKEIEELEAKKEKLLLFQLEIFR